jgi:predicted nucleotidyltransferase component of viral defense system
MYRRDRHNAIAQLLVVLDRDALAQSKCYFGGGTAIAMCFGEYRTSFDVDFLVSDESGYKVLRELVKRGGLMALVEPRFQGILAASSPRIDQYGIRGQFAVAGHDLKFEIVREARIVLETPPAHANVEGILRLSDEDLVAEKLLANSDRYLDAGTFSRDIIDLAFMLNSPLSRQAGHTKAIAAYGDSVSRDAENAVIRLVSKPTLLDRCIEVLEIDSPRAVVMTRLEALL